MRQQGREGGARRYRMRARAESAAATHRRIIEATEACFDEGPYDEITLTKIAERAGVTVQTILRRFGTRQALFVAALMHASAAMGKDREAPVGNTAEAVSILVDHYDEFGDRILRLLAEEDRHAVLRRVADVGRRYHTRWCKRTFAPTLSGLHGAPRKRRIAQLVAVTDIYMWKLLRRDRGLSGQQTKLAMRELLDPLMEPSS